MATTIKLNMNDPRIVELAGLSGASGIWLCNEHVPNDWLNLEHQIRAAKLHDLDSIVRVSKGIHLGGIKRLEDAVGKTDFDLHDAEVYSFQFVKVPIK